MPNGFGRGRGSGRGFGGGMGFGFRGSSPPWPYVGRGRGGLPRCGYFMGGAGAPPAGTYPQNYAYGGPPAYGYRTPADSMTKEEELGYMKDQAEAIKSRLEEIESRMSDLETEE